MNKKFAALVVKSLAVLAVSATVLFCTASRGLAEDTNSLNADALSDTNREAKKPLVSIQFQAGADNDAENLLGLDKATLARLTPEQIVALIKVRRQDPDLSSTMMVPFAFFAAVVVIIVVVGLFRLKRNQEMHRTIRALLDKGQPIPPELFQMQNGQRRQRSDLRRGLVLVGVGVGLAIFLFTQRDPQHQGVWPVALIPLLMGVANLVTWKIEGGKNDPKH